MIKAIIFDLDDTIVECAKYYWDVRDRFIKEVSNRTGVNYEFCAKLFSIIDGHMLKLSGSFNRDRFPTTFRATSLALDAIAKIPIDIDASERAYKLGNSVFDAEYAIFDGVYQTLTELKNDGYLLILNTKGDEEVQTSKLEKNNIKHFFDAIYISQTKNANFLRKILRDFNLTPDEALCVGDSMRDDVATPTEVGCPTVFISTTSPLEWRPRWEYEAQGNGFVNPTYWITTLAELMGVNFDDRTTDAKGPVTISA